MGDGFIVQAAEDIGPTWWDLTTEAGNYLMLLRAPKLLKRWGYGDLVPANPSSVAGLPVVWVGKAAGPKGLQGRITDHLFGDSRKSSLRQTIGALMKTDLGLTSIKRQGDYHFWFGVDEGLLTGWMYDYAAFAYRPSPDPAREEHRLIATLRPVLNIKEQEGCAFSQHLLQLRRTCLGCGMAVPKRIRKRLM